MFPSFVGQNIPVHGDDTVSNFLAFDRLAFAIPNDKLPMLPLCNCFIDFVADSLQVCILLHANNERAGFAIGNSGLFIIDRIIGMGITG